MKASAGKVKEVKRKKKNKAKTIPTDIAGIEFKDKLNGLAFLCVVIVQIDSRFCVTDDRCVIKYWLEMTSHKVISSQTLMGKPVGGYLERFHIQMRRLMRANVMNMALPEYFTEVAIDIVNKNEIITVKRSK